MQMKPFRFGPVALSNVTTTNLLNPGAATGGVNAGTPNLYLLMSHFRLVNKHATLTGKTSLYLGATGANAAGTEVGWTNFPLAAGQQADWYPDGLRLDVADFLVGGCDTASCITIEGEGEIGVA